MKTAKVIGCGLSGVTAAIILKEKGYDVTIFESRSHIGGNCHDSNLAGTLVHNYGPHIFHTNDEEVFNFLSRYTEWFDFKYKPLGNTKLGIISLPYSKKTIKQLGRKLSQEEIVDVIFKDYSEKQWGVPFNEIPKSITNRIPKTKDDEDPTWYKDEKYQCMPLLGYTEMFKNMLKDIDVKLNCHKNEWIKHKTDLTIFTAKIDEYFNFCYGKLPYRSLNFIHSTSNNKLPSVAINQNNKEKSYTRIYDHSYFNHNHHGQTIITEEYPKECKEGDIPFYPMPFGDGLQMYAKYKELANKEKNVIFLGRLATYTYLDMWMAVKQVLLKFKNI
jgi:UDP-galactopyranose mutase